MKIGRVVGTVVSTIATPALAGRRLLLCELLDEESRPSGRDLIAVDAVGAGAGERVLILDEGNSARQVLGWPDAPIRAVVVGIVDAVQGRASRPADGRQSQARKRQAAAPKAGRPRPRKAAKPRSGR